MKQYYQVLPMSISLLLAVLYFFEMIETTFNAFNLITLASVLGLIIGVIYLSLKGEKNPLESKFPMTKGAYKSYVLMISICSVIAIAGILNTHIPSGKPIMVNTVVMDKEIIGRPLKHCIIVNVDGYGKLSVRVDNKLWSKLSVGKPIVLTVQKGLLGYFIEKSIAEYGGSS